ncbi:MAG: patatin-like phospholipase family protein [Balneolaceae bacterium]
MHHRFTDIILLVFVTGVLSSLTARISAQGLPKDSQPDPKIGLVLSGGGAKGIAHIGALRIIEEAGIEVDFITGTSMGSIVGALYAIGYTPDELEHLAGTTDWEQLFTDRPDRPFLSMYEKEVDERFIVSFPITERGINLPSGLVAGQNIYTWLTKHTWPVHEKDDFSEFQIPFSTLATDLETGEAVVFRSGFLPDAIRASISLPSLLIPHVVDGRTLIDGGFIRNLPVTEVLEMGADYVIAIDVSTPLRLVEELNSIATIMNQTMNFRVADNISRQKKLADLVIDIDELDEYSIVDFNQAENFIRIGEQTTRRWMNELQKIAEHQTTEHRTVKEPVPEPDPFLIGKITIGGNDQIPGDFIRTELEISEGDRITSEIIEQSINRLYSTRLFNLITYRILMNSDAESYHLHFRVIENTDDSFRVGVRYENETQASIRLHSAFRNLLHRGSNLRFDLRLGRETGFQTEYLYFGGVRSRYGLRSQFQYKGEEIDYYESANRVSSLTHHLFRMDLFTGTFLDNTYLLGLGIRKDFTTFAREINPGQLLFSDKDHHALYALLWVDSFNRRSYPTRGHRLFIQGTFSDPLFLSPLSFNEQHLYWKAWYPLQENLSIQHTLYAGRSYGEELPWSYWYSLNRQQEKIGYIRFGGYHRYELTGRNIQMLSAGIQFEIARHRFIRLDLYTGNTMDKWDWNVTELDLKTGYSLSAGILTVLGPVEAIVSGSGRYNFLFELQVGYEF